MSTADDRIAELERKLNEEIESRKKLAKALLNLIDSFERHVSGEMTINDIQKCLEKVQEVAMLLQQAGLFNTGGEGGIASVIAQVLKAQQSQALPPVEMKSLDKEKTKKLKKLLEDEEDEDESEEEG